MKQFVKLSFATICTLFAILVPIYFFPQLLAKEIFWFWAIFCSMLEIVYLIEERTK